MILAIWLDLSSVIYSQIALFLALNRTFFPANRKETLKRNNQSHDIRPNRTPLSWITIMCLQWFYLTWALMMLNSLCTRKFLKSRQKDSPSAFIWKGCMSGTPVRLKYVRLIRYKVTLQFLSQEFNFWHLQCRNKWSIKITQFKRG